MTEQVNAEQRNQLMTDWAKFRQSFSNEAPPRETARSWGFEIETPEADTLYNAMSREQLATMEFCEDASIEGGGWGVGSSSGVKPSTGVLRRFRGMAKSQAFLPNCYLMFTK